MSRNEISRKINKYVVYKHKPTTPVAIRLVRKVFCVFK